MIRTLNERTIIEKTKRRSHDSLAWTWRSVRGAGLLVWLTLMFRMKTSKGRRSPLSWPIMFKVIAPCVELARCSHTWLWAFCRTTYSHARRAIASEKPKPNGPGGNERTLGPTLCLCSTVSSAITIHVLDSLWILNDKRQRARMTRTSREASALRSDAESGRSTKWWSLDIC